MVLPPSQPLAKDVNQTKEADEIPQEAQRTSTPCFEPTSEGETIDAVGP